MVIEIEIENRVEKTKLYENPRQASQWRRMGTSQEDVRLIERIDKNLLCSRPYYHAIPKHYTNNVKEL